MAGSTFGTRLKLSTCGESHGGGLMGILDGFPPNITIDVDQIQAELNRRKPGQSPYTTQRKEADKVEILSGIFEGKTTGTPIGILIQNTDQRSKDYTDIAQKFRPGHADYTYFKKYRHHDYRGGGRASARETVIRVAAGSFAKQYLAKYNIHIQGYVSQIGPIKAGKIDLSIVENNPFFFPDPDKIEALKTLLNDVRAQKDSVGAKVCAIAYGVPPGVGEPVFNKLGALIMQAVGSINAVKGVEIGDGFDVVKQKGSIHQDQMDENGFLSNHSGGILGGISNGQPIVVRAAFKPTPSIAQPLKTINQHNQATEITTKGRHDPCVGIRAVPIVEAMIALVLMDLHLQQKVNSQDS